jgi:hypothetical protein
MKKLTLACALSLLALSAFAQRTFVSVSGLDTNSCSTLQACRTIQQALNAVAASGDVIMMDTGGFGNDSKVPNCSGVGELLITTFSPASRSQVTLAPAIRKTFATAC